MYYKYVHILFCITCCSAALLAGLLVTQSGAGISPDSTAYIRAGENLYLGHGIYNGYSPNLWPLTHWPPFYPILIALFMHINLTAEDAARIIPILFFALSMFPIFYLGRLIDGNFTAYIGCIICLIFTPLLKITSFAWTEMIYISLSLISILGLVIFSHNKNKVCLYISGAFVSFAILTRYIGITLLFVGIIIIILNNKSIKICLYDILIYSSISLIPIFIWLYRNILLTGLPFGGRAPSSTGILQNIDLLMRTIVDDFFSLVLPEEASYYYASIVILFGTMIIISYKNTSLKWFKANHILIIYISIYFSTLLIMASEICFDRIEYRLTCPTYPFMLLTLISFIHINYRGLKYQLHKIGCYLAVILILIILVHIQITNSVEFYQFAKDGQGYNSPDWKYEDDIRWLRDLPSNNVTIFTNRQDAIQFILKRPSYGLTRNINLNDEDDTYIIYFKDRYTLGWYENIIDMDRDTLTVVFDSSRTIIYKTDSGDKSQLRDICKPILDAGYTTQGLTKWVQYGSNGIFVDVNTSSAGFTETPIYITSLGGYYHHWRTTGTTSIYNATPTGFRVYVFYEDGPVTPAQANSWGWHIQWVGIPRNKVNASSTTPGATDWVKYGNKELYVDVNTSSAGFNETPIYVTSLGGSSKHWRAIGTTSIYSATPTGFRVHVFYEDGAVTPTQANSCKWHIQWIGI